MSLRTKAIGFATNPASEFVDRAKSVFAGDSEENPTIRVPSYYIKIVSPKAGDSYADLYKQLLAEQTISPENIMAKKKAVETLRLVLTGTTSTETEFEHLDVQIKTTRRRWKRSGKTTVRIFNPSKEKVEIIKRGSLIKIYVGWETKTRFLAFYGPVTRVEQEWENSGDFYIKLTCIQYEEAVMNNTTFYPSNPDNTVVPMVEIPITQSETFIDPMGGYYDALETLIDDHLNPRAEQVYGVPLALDPDFRQIITLRDVPSTAVNLKFAVKPKRTQSMAEVLDDFFKQAAPNLTGGTQVVWWVDNRGVIRFPFNEILTAGRKDGSAIIGDNAFKVSIVSDSPDLLTTVGEVLTEPTNDKQDVSLIVHMVGRGSTQLEDVFTINEAFTESVINTLEQQADNFGLYDLRNLKWIVDQIDHTMDSEKQFVTRLVMVQPGETNDTDPTGRSTRNKDKLNTMAAFRSEARAYVDEEIKKLKEEVARFGLYVNYNIPPDGSAPTELPAVISFTPGETTLIEEGRDDPADTDIDPADSPQANTILTATNDPTIVDSPLATDQPASNYLTGYTALNSSPWAVEFLDKKSQLGKYYGGGVWYPVSKLPFDEMRRRAVLQTVGGQDIIGMSHWAHGRAPIGYHTDYIMRTPSRSVDVVPTEINTGGKTVIESDDGTRTQIFTQYLVDANPLIDGRVRGIISRPHIKDVISLTGDGTSGRGTKDDEITLMVSTPTRSSVSKRIVRHTGTTFGAPATDQTDAKPEILDILDDMAVDGKRMEDYWHNVDGNIPTREIIVGNIKIDITGNVGSEEIAIVLDKSNAASPRILMQPSLIALNIDQSDDTAGSIRLSSGQIDLDAATVNLGKVGGTDAYTVNGNLSVEGTLSVAGKTDLAGALDVAGVTKHGV